MFYGEMSEFGGAPQQGCLVKTQFFLITFDQKGLKMKLTDYEVDRIKSGGGVR